PDTERVAPLIATALIAVLFQPLRSRLRRVVSQLVFGARDDPYEVLTRLGQQLEATASADAILDGAVATLARTLRLPYAAIELYAMNGERVPAATFGIPTGEPVSIALVHQGTELGRLILDTGPAREQFGPADQRLLDALARQLAVTAHNVQLTLRLQRSLQQTVAAREEERRRLRRDLHDGLGPALAAGTMQLEVARRLVESNPTQAEALLAKLADNQQSLIADLRQLVEGLRPPVLDQLGLVSALQQRSTRFATGTSPLLIHIDASDNIEPLPAAVEVAAYRIVLESLTNTARHAQATEATVQLRRSDGLLIQVRDNGCGLPDSYRAGVGLTSIRERATELGGSASITSAPGEGTLVQARLPLPQ
ncbi:MAG: sensor histidine kinase, partial [Actinobacteria bacterium]|nr:sensor histidine kinase [Actinomycetota bacterium]